MLKSATQCRTAVPMLSQLAGEPSLTVALPRRRCDSLGKKLEWPGVVRSSALDNPSAPASDLLPGVVKRQPYSKVPQAVLTLGQKTVEGTYSWYCSCLEQRPLLTKACTSFVGFMIGDMIAQQISHHGFVDLMRVGRLGAYGLFIDGPVGSLWYELLEVHVCPEDPTGTKAVLLKTAADQLLWAPVMTVVFFAVVKSLEGHPELVWQTVHDKTLPTLLANYLIWPLAHFINFKYVPHDFRILYNNTVSIAWLTWLSMLTHKIVRR